jgi:SpoVK/Ycf46/Vps4 family AAA+-type ATPase
MAHQHLELIGRGVTAVAKWLTDHLEQGQATHEAEQRWARFEERVRDAPDHPLAQLTARHHLDTFGLQTVLLALAWQVEPRIAGLVADAGADGGAGGVTVHMAVDCFANSAVARYGARMCFLPSAPLVRGGILHVRHLDSAGSPDLLRARIELTEPTLRFLLGEPELGTHLRRFARLDHPAVDFQTVILPAERLQQVRTVLLHHDRFRSLIGEWSIDPIAPGGRGMTALFSGASGTGKSLLAAALASHMSRPLITVFATDLPAGGEVEGALLDVFAEARLRDAIVLIDECDALLGKGDRRRAAVYQAMADFDGVLLFVTNHPEALDESLERRIVLRLPFDVPDMALREQIWEVHLPAGVPLSDDIDLPGLASRYDYSGGTIRNAVLMAIHRALARAPHEPVVTQDDLEHGCRSQLRSALESLTTRSSTHLRLGDIALPDALEAKAREILAACRNQSQVLNAWGFGERLATGKGITILLDGPPGTGKTFLAEILAGELDQPLFRISIPDIVSKWVGETEKHIRQVFQEARVSHAILLFDEADALFASRSAETKSSSDRYANMEVNLLLQEVERFPGVCILTTNHFGALDPALVRRIQFRGTFEEPDAGQRERIWKTLCPRSAPLGVDVDFAALAEEFALVGGHIKNALLRAAYSAADAGTTIDQATLRRACREECKAAGKLVRDLVPVPASPAEVAR